MLKTMWHFEIIQDGGLPWSPPLIRRGGGVKRPLFQNHAVSICEGIDGHFITYDEAHYICGIMNTPIAADYILKSSDSRSFPIRPRIYIPRFDNENSIHAEISLLSKEAHQKYDSETDMHRITERLNMLYLHLARNR